MTTKHVFALGECSKTRGDCTASYGVIVDKGCTVKEFIEDVLTRNEWGYVGIYKEGQAWFERGTPKCEYKGDKLIYAMPEEVLSREVIKASADGGWSRMDYLLYI